MVAMNFHAYRVLALLLCLRSSLAASNVLYTLANDPRGASIVALSLSENGTVLSSTLTPTGGNGSSGTSAPGSPAVGSLFGSRSVVVSGNYLFNVNPGSNTVSMFAINPAYPTNPALVGKPVDTMGEFPMSLAFSPALKTVCVLNGGKVSGVTCFSADPVAGLKTLDQRPRSLAKALNQTTPPLGPFATASDIMFNPSSSALVASIKGDPTKKPIKPGYLYAWPVVGGRVSDNAVINQPPGVVVDFSLAFQGNDFELLLTDPAIGADIIGVAADLSMNVLQPINVTGQAAICWSYYAPELGVAFLIDTAKDNITTVNVKNGAVDATIDYFGKGAIDSAVAGSSFYSVTQDATVLNFDVSGLADGKLATQVQNFNPNVPNPSKVTALLVGLGVYSSTQEAYYVV